MPCMGNFGSAAVARGFDRHVAEIQIRIGVLRGGAALGIAVADAVEQACQGMGNLGGQPTYAIEPLL